MLYLTNVIPLKMTSEDTGEESTTGDLHDYSLRITCQSLLLNRLDRALCFSNGNTNKAVLPPASRSNRTELQILPVSGRTDPQ